jgi:hypothetical protein
VPRTKNSSGLLDGSCAVWRSGSLSKSLRRRALIAFGMIRHSPDRQRALDRRGLSSFGTLNRWPREDGAFVNLAFLFSRNNLPLLRRSQKLNPV